MTKKNFINIYVPRELHARIIKAKENKRETLYDVIERALDKTEKKNVKK